MKVTKHVEKLLRQGRKPKELIELGFSKTVITRARRQLKKEKLASLPASAGKTPAQVKPDSLESEVQQLQMRVESLETASVKIKDIETRLHGTPVIGLKQHFTCTCGSTGYVAVHVKCTKCGKEDYWGWWPEKELLPFKLVD